MVEVARKKCKGAAVYRTHYDEGWERLYLVGPINRNKNVFFCIPCEETMSCAHQGVREVKQHVGGKE